MSIGKDPEAYERFDSIVLVHGVRWLKESAVKRHFVGDLKQAEILGDMARAKHKMGNTGKTRFRREYFLDVLGRIWLLHRKHNFLRATA